MHRVRARMAGKQTGLENQTEDQHLRKAGGVASAILGQRMEFSLQLQ